MTSHDEFDRIGARMYGDTDNERGARVYGLNRDTDSIGDRIYNGGAAGAATSYQQERQGSTRYEPMPDSVVPRRNGVDYDTMGKQIYGEISSGAVSVQTSENIYGDAQYSSAYKNGRPRV